MRRGFKAEAERLAAGVRRELELTETEDLDLRLVASLYNSVLVPADELVPRRRLVDLQQIQPDAFSAGTFRLDNGRLAIVFNPLHGEGRIRSDQAHELAHITLDHSVRTIERIGNLNFLTCDTAQEEEADWLGGCLLLPRPLLFDAAKKRLSPEEIAKRYKTSVPMARFRLNASGVLVQLGRSKARATKGAGSG